MRKAKRGIRKSWHWSLESKIKKTHYLWKARDICPYCKQILAMQQWVLKEDALYANPLLAKQFYLFVREHRLSDHRQGGNL